MQIAGLRPKSRPAKNTSYKLRRKDITIEHVSQKKGRNLTYEELESAELAKVFTYDDFKNYYINFDKEMETSQTQEFKAVVKPDKAKASMLIDEHQEHDDFEAPSFGTDLSGSIMRSEDAEKTKDEKRIKFINRPDADADEAAKMMRQLNH